MAPLLVSKPIGNSHAIRSSGFFTRYAPFRNGTDNPRRLPFSATSGLAIPRVTDLRMFRGKRVLLIADSDNWDYSLKPHGLRLQYGGLLDRLKRRGRSRVPGSCADLGTGRLSVRLSFPENCGWRVVSIPWETITTCGGTRKLANADTDLAFECGYLCVSKDCDAALIGTGDGDLAVSIARGLRRIHRRMPIAIHTLSVVGASSSRLWQRTDLFDSSVMIGRDMLDNMNSRHYFSFHPISKGSFHGV